MNYYIFGEALKMNKQKPTYISLFSSAGVGCYGFKLQGFECVATNELVERRINVQKFNKKCKYDSGYICGDITSEEIRNKLFNEIDLWKKKESLKEIDVVIATPPCQGMSVANHKKTDDEIKRNSLVVESIKIIIQIKPKFFIFENVAAFMKTACTDTNGQTITIAEAIENNLEKNYSIFSNIINFKNYGACSSRTRTIVIGVRKDLADFVSPMELFPDFKEERTLRETIGHLKPLFEFGEIDNNDIYHAFRIYPEHMRAWISELSEGQSAFDNIDINRIPHKVVDGEVICNQNKNGDKYKRQIWDKVGPCIHTRNDQLASQNTIHPTDDRVFSIRELMLMMTIPNDFKWVETPIEDLNNCSNTKKTVFFKKEEIKIRQSLGEAVPTAIFSAIAEKICFFLTKKHLKTQEINKELEQHDLTLPQKLLKYINENKNNLGNATLCKIAELANAKRTQHAAYFTNKFIMNEIMKTLPCIDKDEVRVLEPSVGVGNFIPFIIKKYASTKKLIIDVVDIDNNALDILKALLAKIDVPKNVDINYINADFLLYYFNSRYDVIIGNPPFNKLKPNDFIVKQYRLQAYNIFTTNTFSFFIEKAMQMGDYVSMITPKFLLNTPEFVLTRKLIAKKKIDSIIDFGEKGFEDVLVETICINIEPNTKPSYTNVFSVTFGLKLYQKQSYITDDYYPYWIIYRNNDFDSVANKLEFGIFDVFRDRQITNGVLKPNGDIRVIKSRNISDDGTCIKDIENYDAFIDEEKSQKLGVFRFLNKDDVYLTPNMTYKPRVIRKPKGVLVNGSAAILIPKKNVFLTDDELLYFSSNEYREFYKIARNYQTRSLNVDASSVFFFGRIKMIGETL
jgi:DNA (cytosine-5)-methyltransferase 1